MSSPSVDFIPARITWLNRKQIHTDRVEKYLSASLERNQFTNGGPCVKLLESRVRELLNIDAGKAVIVVNNGASALHAIASGLQIALNRNLKWATSSFTFPASAQGSLQGSFIVDIDESAGPDISLLPENIDGLIVTNVLGHVGDLQKYQDWAEKNGKFLVLDNAACSSSFYRGTNTVNIGVASIISFHHTKPIGFGEGGAVIIDSQYEQAIRNVINFGYDMVKLNQIWLPEGSNFKMSDVAAAYILQYFDDFDTIKQKHQELYQYFSNRVSQLNNGVKLFPNFSENTPFVSSLVVVFPTTIVLDRLSSFNIEVKKYYKPLLLEGNALDLYSRIACFPCHIGMSVDDVDRVVSAIQSVN